MPNPTPPPSRIYTDDSDVDDDELRDDTELSRQKRAAAPSWFGQECPVCGAPFDTGSSGVVWPDALNSTDAIAWVRTCTGPVPPHLRADIDTLHSFPAESVPFQYVHKDEHLSTTD